MGEAVNPNNDMPTLPTSPPIIGSSLIPVTMLEALVGRDFLPRGCDICTRRPPDLMLENRPPSSDDVSSEWGEFRHLPGRRFYDFSEIRREIQVQLSVFIFQLLFFF